MDVTTTTPLDWDQWRAAYPAMSYADQQAYHSAIYERYPTQRHFDTTYVARAIDQVQPQAVVEIGGWNGELARNMLARFYGINSWTNIEVCLEARNEGKDTHPRYHTPHMDDWYWTQQWHCDLFVASHTIEHLSVHHLDQTIGATDAYALFMDAPLLDQPFNWQGFTGTHILETGWHGVTDICSAHGYSLAWAEDHDTDPSSGDRARACLYLREDS